MTKDSDFKKLVRQRMAATGQSYTEARAAMYHPAAAADLPLPRRVFGLTTLYTASFDGGQAPAGAGEYLFRRLVTAGRSVNVFLENGARFCLRPDESDVAQPTYGTAECDSITELVAAECAGDEIVARLAAGANEALASEGSPATLAVSTGRAAQSESYLISSAVTPDRYLRLLEPFLATRWVYGGVAPRAALAPASFADESRYRRLKITGADPGLSQLATFLTVGATEQVLRLAESYAGVSLDHRRSTPRAGAVGTQRAYLAAARRIRRRPEDDVVLDAWQAALDNHEDSQRAAPGKSERYGREFTGVPADNIRPIPAISDPSQADASIVTPAQIETAVGMPPQTTRARLRGLFITTAKDHRRNFTVDWVHLKLNDTANPTLTCWDPLDANFETADRLIASISGPPQ